MVRRGRKKERDAREKTAGVDKKSKERRKKPQDPNQPVRPPNNDTVAAAVVLSFYCPSPD